MNLLRRIAGWVIGAIPSRYRGSKLDRFGPSEQQDIVANRFRSGT